MPALSNDPRIVKKDARKTRDAAYRARRQLFNKARQHVDDRFLASPEYAAVQKANDSLLALMDERNRRQDALRQQIADLENGLKKTNEDFEQKCIPVNQARSQATRAAHALETTLRQEVNALFPDVCHAFSPAGWKPELISKEAPSTDPVKGPGLSHPTTLNPSETHHAQKPLPVPQEPLSQMSMGMAVRACRQASDRTMTAVAKSTGLALSVLSRIETGSRGLGYSEAVILANELGVPLDKFAHMARAIEKNGAPERIKENRQLAEDMITMAQNANALRAFIAA